MRLSKKKIKLIMARNELSTAELAKRCGLTRQRVCCIFNSVSVRPETAGKIARALGVDVTEIIED